MYVYLTPSPPLNGMKRPAVVLASEGKDHDFLGYQELSKEYLEISIINRQIMLREDSGTSYLVSKEDLSQFKIRGGVLGNYDCIVRFTKDISEFIEVDDPNKGWRYFNDWDKGKWCGFGFHWQRGPMDTKGLFKLQSSKNQLGEPCLCLISSGDLEKPKRWMLERNDRWYLEIVDVREGSTDQAPL